MKPDFYKGPSALKNITKSPGNIYAIAGRFRRLVKPVLAGCLLCLISICAQAQGTYTWTGATSDFQLSTNWSPPRVTADPGDVLIFQNITQTVTNVPSQSVATITVQVSGGAAII